jgi:hypothetical protein
MRTTELLIQHLNGMSPKFTETADWCDGTVRSTIHLHPIEVSRSFPLSPLPCNDEKTFVILRPKASRVEALDSASRGNPVLTYPCFHLIRVGVDLNLLSENQHSRTQCHVSLLMKSNY